MTNYQQLQQAAQIVIQGGIIAYPTEAVWGLGCDPCNEQAVLKLLALKARPVNKGLILIAASIEQFDFILHDLPENLLECLNSKWPGPYTWLVPHHDRVPAWIAGEHNTVALRVTNHPLVKQLCELTGPIVSTSANPADSIAAKTKLQVENYFQGKLDFIVSGSLGKEAQPSQICDLLTGKIIR